ncbi:MAG: DUF364 domain-containing protein [Christensenella sp.]|uniref:Rossmann-like domain-containing protein n=1 Tax=Christensenella sp. TaxID=1935934 RepID=UPI002B2207D0|nr:DUF364 domain-containing protein [Christensenella sp.]MEA5002524.1 DUF364 domain-containing protein [Christensenella sp.]
MTKKELYGTLKRAFEKVLKDAAVTEGSVQVVCRGLTPEEAIGKTQRQDFPIITGKDVMIEAVYKGYRGQAFTDAPSQYTGGLGEILDLDIENNPRDRGVFIATVNAVMAALGRCTGTVHCRTDGPEQCALEMQAYLKASYPEARRIALIGYQPALLEMLATSGYALRVLDLNPANVGQRRYGVMVEDGSVMQDAVTADSDLILCTGSTLCNGTIVDYMDLPVPVLFFGITIAGSADLLGVKRVCFAEDLKNSSGR